MLGGPVFTSLPSGLGFHGEPLWWPLLPLTLAGLLVGLTICFLPRQGRPPPSGQRSTVRVGTWSGRM